MRKVTPRVNTISHIKEALGRTVYTNISPTMKAKLIGYDEDKSYFEVLPHEKDTVYNECAGQEFYVTTQMALSFKYLKE